MALISFVLVACGDWTLQAHQPRSEDDTKVVDRDDDGTPAAEDCDDEDPAVHPGAVETCDGRDEDCDSEVDEGLAWQDWYADADGDSYGNADAPLYACAQPAGRVADATDCEDDDDEVHPGAPEWCDNGRDDDCDGLYDEADAADARTYYADADGDRFGSSGAEVTACRAPAGHADVAGDCDDADAAVNPSAAEVCDAVDNDCDGTVDEAEAADAATWHPDADGDGRGDPDVALEVVACEAPPGHVAEANDCDDADAAFPDNASYSSEYVTALFTGSAPKSTLHLGDVSIPLTSYLTEIAAGSYRVPDDVDVCYFVANAYTDPDLDRVELQTYVSTAEAPPVSDRYFASLQWNLHAIGAADAWQCATGDGVTVAVIDTGVSPTAYDGFGNLADGGTCEGSAATDHVSLRFTSPRDPVDPSHVYIAYLDGTTSDCTYTRRSITDPCWAQVIEHDDAMDRCTAGNGQTDGNGHGTHVAGIVNQAAGNGIGVAGVAPGATVVPVKANLGATGSFNTFDVAAGIHYAVRELGADVINLSLGGSCDASGSEALRAAVAFASARRVVVTIAAGNDGCDHLWTTWEEASASTGVMVVGNATRVDGQTFTYTRATSSNHGAGLDLVAPGTDVVQGYSAEHGCPDGTVGVSGVALCPRTGTSMAAPHVAGAAALLVQRGATARQAETALLNTAHQAAGWLEAEVGAGMVDAAAALERVTRCTCAYREGTSEGWDAAAGACGDVATPHWSPPAGCSIAEAFAATGGDWGTAGEAPALADDVRHHAADVNGDFRDDFLAYDATTGEWTVALALSGAPTGGAPRVVPTTPEAGGGVVAVPTFGGCPSGTVQQALVGDTDGSGAADLVLWCTDGSWWRALAVDDRDDGDGQPDSFRAWDAWKTGFGAWEELVWTSAWTGDAPTCDAGTSASVDLDDDGVSDGTVRYYASTIEAHLADVDGDGADDPVIFDFGAWYVSLAGTCEATSCQDSLHGQLWVSGFGDDDVFDRVAAGASSNRVWYASHVFDADGNGTADLLNFYNNGDWWVVPAESAVAALGAGAPLENTGFNLWLEEGGDSADQVLHGDFNGDALPDVLAAYVNDGRSISCEMTELMEAQGAGLDTCVYGTGTCEPAAVGVDPTVCGTSDGYRDYVCSDYDCAYDADTDEFLGYVCGACGDCDHGWGTATTGEWHVYVGQDTDADGLAERFRPASDSRTAWISAVSGTYAGHHAADVDGDGVADVLAVDGDDAWDAWLAAGLSCP